MKEQIMNQNMEGVLSGANTGAAEEAPQGTFKKDLSKMNIWALALGAIIGWGCFVMPGVNFLPEAGPSAMLGMLIGGMVMAIISFSYGYCIKKYPLSAGSLSTPMHPSEKSTHLYADGFWSLGTGH